MKTIQMSVDESLLAEIEKCRSPDHIECTC
jgi:hypothetical protein